LIEEKPWMKKNVPCDVITGILKRKFGGLQYDYDFLYNFFVQFNTEDSRSKMMLNHSSGIFDAESVFGVTFKRESDKKEIPTRTVAESIMSTNFGFIPTFFDWSDSIKEQPWMYAKAIALSKDENL
jgi:hypothetical protein